MDAETALTIIGESGVNPFPLEMSGDLLSLWPLPDEGWPVTPSPVDIRPEAPVGPDWDELEASRIMCDPQPNPDGPRQRVVFDSRLLSGEPPGVNTDLDVLTEVSAYALTVVLLRQQAARDDRYSALGSTPADSARRARARSKQYLEWAATVQAGLDSFGTGWATALTPADPPNKLRKKVRSLW